MRYMETKEGETAFTFPTMVMTRVPGCCSAGNINFVQSARFPITAKKIQELQEGVAVEAIEDPKKSSLPDNGLKVVSLVNARGYIYSKDGVSRIALWLLALRINESTNPFLTIKSLKDRSSNPQEPGRYSWPSKVWSMYDRTDLDNTRDFRTRTWGEWLEDNAEEAGLFVVRVDGESVHALEEEYTTFGSDKPDGYGTISNWIIVVKDSAKFKEWYNTTTEEILAECKPYKLTTGESITW